MKNRSRLWFALIIILIALCTATALAAQDDTVSFTLAGLHYSIPAGWNHIEYEEDGNDYLYHFSDASGAIGDGAILAGALYGDYTGYSPEEFYAACYDDLVGESGYAGKTVSCEISGVESAVLYVDGPIYDVGESASASLVILQDDRVYWLSFYAGTGKAEDWDKYITQICIEDAASNTDARVSAPEAVSKSSGNDSSVPDGNQYVGNKNTKKFHHSWCSSVDQMKDSNKISLSSRDAAISAGYDPCKRCNP